MPRKSVGKRNCKKGKRVTRSRHGGSFTSTKKSRSSTSIKDEVLKPILFEIAKNDPNFQLKKINKTTIQELLNYLNTRIDNDDLVKYFNLYLKKHQTPGDINDINKIKFLLNIPKFKSNPDKVVDTPPKFLGSTSI